jgi:hypothetical protein
MDIFTHDELKVLMEERLGVCVSIYLRTHSAGNENGQQDRIRFRNALIKAEEQLTAFGMRPPDARKLTEPVRRLDADDAFWKFQSEGLAIFLTDGLFRSYRLPLAFDDLLLVSGRFHLKPLLPMVAEAGEYYLLALSQRRVRLMQGGRFGIFEVSIPDVPQGVDNALGAEQNETYLQFHSRGQSSTGGSRPALFWGSGEGRNDDKDRVTRYFRRVDEAVQGYLQSKGSPLVLAGVEYLLPLYREVSAYPQILPEVITGNADDLQPGELHAKAWPLVEPLVLKRQQQATEELYRLLGTGKASTFTPEIVPASFQGRVAKLLVSSRQHEWGAVDRANAGAVSHACEQGEQGCEDLYDLAAVQTLLKGGEVYVLESDTVANGAHIAAVYRY